MYRISSRLQLKDFRLILAIQQSGQLAIAADHLGMTQPAASRLLASIEATLGMKLFERHPKGMTPTPVGEILSRNAVNLIRNLDATEREIAAANIGQAGTARVGSVTGGAVGFVVPAIQELKKTTSGAEIYVDVGPSDMLINGLVQGDFDFVLSRIPAGTDARQFDIKRGRTEVIHFLVRENHPLSRLSSVSLGDLEGFEWVIQAPHTPMRRAVEEAFLASGKALPPEIVNTTSLLVMIAYLNATDAIAPASGEVAELLTRQQGECGMVALSLADPIIINPYHVISLRGHVLNPLASRLRELVCRKLSPGGGRDQSEA